MFTHFRTLGGICGNVFDLQRLGPEYFLAVAVADAYAIYNVDKFEFRVASQRLGRIRALASFKDVTFAATDTAVAKCIRGRQTAQFCADNVTQMAVYGDYLCVLGTQLWTIVHSTMSLHSCINVAASVFLHPHTYLNKLLVGGDKLQLWNIFTGSLIYEYGLTKVSSLAQSSAADIVAVGHLDGTIRVVNIKEDAVLFYFNQASAVLSMSFRSDDDNMLATCGSEGVALWDLGERRLNTLLHTECQWAAFLEGEPRLLVGACNSLKQYIFEYNVPRLLKERSGHSVPPTKLLYYGDRHIILAGDGLRVFCTQRHSNSFELSQGAQLKRKNIERLPPVIDFDANDCKRFDWDDIVSIHGNYVCTWSFEFARLGHKVFTSDKSCATCVCISKCGSFCSVGTCTGVVDLFSMQSGILKSFTKHSHPIVGLGYTDQLITCTTHHVIGTKSVSIEGISIFRVNGLLMLAATNNHIHVIDENFNIVRILKHFDILDVRFSPNAMRIVSASSNGSVSTFDVLSGLLVYEFTVNDFISCLCFSHNGEYLATTNTNSLCATVYLHDPSIVSTCFSEPQNMLCLSGHSKERLKSIMNIKKREEKQIVSVPFFLDSDSTTFTKVEETKIVGNVEISGFSLESEFVALLKTNNVAFLRKLFASAPSVIDAELKMLPSDYFELFLESLSDYILGKQSFDLCMTILSVFLKYHAKELVGIKALYTLESNIKSTWTSLQNDLRYALCLTAFCLEK